MAENQALWSPASGIVCAIVERRIIRPRYLQKMQVRHVSFLEMMFVFLDRNPASRGWPAQVCLPPVPLSHVKSAHSAPGVNLSVTGRAFSLIVCFFERSRRTFFWLQTSTCNRVGRRRAAASVTRRLRVAWRGSSKVKSCSTPSAVDATVPMPRFTRSSRSVWWCRATSRIFSVRCK